MAEDIDKTMKDVCEYYEKEITTAYQDIEKFKAFDERHLANISGAMSDEDYKTHLEWLKSIKDKFKELKEEAKTYHYLDCSDFR